MRVVFLGKKPSAARALEYLAKRGVTITAVVAPPNEHELYWEPKLKDTATHLGIPLINEEELYAYIEEPSRPPRPELEGCVSNIDFVFSFLFWNRIKKCLITLGNEGCVNFHPAPLPDFRGVNGYNIALYEGLSSWGVAAHFVEETIDTGPIIRVETFPIDPEKETVVSLEQKSQQRLLQLFQEITELALKGDELPRVPQKGGRYISKVDFEKLRKVNLADTPQEIKRKIKSFWYPPYPGAAMTIGDEEYTLVDQSILNTIAIYLHRQHPEQDRG